jgi:ATPase subunit of ABC transporter with duplicated ATPase domains
MWNRLEGRRRQRSRDDETQLSLTTSRRVLRRWNKRRRQRSRDDETIIRRIQKMECIAAIAPDQPRSIELQFICPETKEVVASRVIEVGHSSAHMARVGPPGQPGIATDNSP